MELSTEPSRVFLPRSSQFVIACDLGQAMDHTAVAILEKKIGVIDMRSEFDRHCNIAGPPQKRAERIDVRDLHRLPLGTSYPNVITHVCELLARVQSLCGDDKRNPVELVIDETGPGKPVGDIFVASGLKEIVRVTITAGNEVSNQGGNRWNVAKKILISRLDALLHTGELKFAAKLAEAEAMKNELLDFRRKLTDSGAPTYGARSGRHDDLVLAVAIGVWAFTRPRNMPAQFTTYRYAEPGESTQNSYGGD
jgi:hypothetical protein